MINLGLTFGGGGGKGSYEIGVWKALKEFGVDKYIKSVSGTSVGALNSALFIDGDYEKAENVWTNITQDSILKPNQKKILDFFTSLNLPGATVNYLNKHLSKYASTGVFTQKGLEGLIRNNLDTEKISNSEIPVYVCAVNWQTRKPHYVKLNGEEPENIVKYLLASSAIPVVFEKVVVKGIPYYDGGIPLIGDNIPVAPVIAEGNNFVLSVFLNQDEEFGRKELQYKNTKFWKLVPKESQGGFIDGTLDFNPDRARIRIRQGYEDAKEVLQQFYEFMLIEQKFIEKVDEIDKLDKMFNVNIEENKLLRKLLDEKERKALKGINSLQYLLEKGTSELPDVKNDKVAIINNSNLEEIKTNIESHISDIEKKLIDETLDETIEKFKDNSKLITELAFEGLTALQPVKGRSEALLKQGLLKRIWNAITGKNLRLIAESQNDLYKAVYVNQQLIKKLAEKSMLTMDVLVTYGNRIEYLQKQIQLQNVKFAYVYEGLDLLRASISSLIGKLQEKFRNIDERLAKLEHGQKILYWRTNLQAQIFEGKHYRQLPDNQKIALTVSELFNLTNGVPKNDYYVTLKSSLIDLGIEENNETDVYEFFAELNGDKELGNRFLKNVQTTLNPLDAPKQVKNNFPLLSGLETTLTTSSMSNEALAEKINRNALIPQGIKIKSLDFAVELLFSLYSGMQSRYSNVKDELLNALRVCEEIETDERSTKVLAEKISSLIKEIEQYKVFVPLIGPFNAGKSSLLNAYLERKLLPIDQTPTTALAAELHYGEYEKIIVHYLDGKTETLEIDEIEKIDVTNKNVFYLEIHLNDNKLLANGDVVLVDMPGLDSNVENHTKAIQNYINRGSYFILVLNSKYQLEKSVYSFIDELVKNKRNYSIVLTRKASLLEKNEEAIKKSLLPYVSSEDKIGFVESKGKWRDIEFFNKTIQYVKDIKEDLTKEKFENRVSEIINELKNRFARLLKKDNKTAADIQKEIDELQEELANVEKEVKKQLERFRNKIANEAVENVVEAVKSKLHGNVETLVSAAEMGGTNLQAQIADMIRPVLNVEIKREVEKASSKLVKRVKSIYADAIEPSVGPVSIAAPETKSINKVLAGAAVIAFIFNPIAGFVLGIASLFSSKNSKSSKRDEIRLQIVGQVIPQAVSSVRTNARESLTKIAADIEQQLLKEVDLKKESILKTMEEKKESKLQSEKEYEAKKEFWQESLDKLNSLSIK